MVLCSQPDSEHELILCTVTYFLLLYLRKKKHYALVDGETIPRNNC